MLIGHLVVSTRKSSCGVLVCIATYLLYGVHAVNDFTTCIVVPIMYLLVFALLVWSEVWVVVCALRALIVYYVYYIADSTDPLTYTVVALNIFCVHFT
jgi:hypothetical protein